jgi:hypothetical protein
VLVVQEHAQRYHPLPNLDHRGSRLVPINLRDVPCRTISARVRARRRRGYLDFAWPSHRRLSTHELGLSIDGKQRFVRLEVDNGRVQGILSREYDVHPNSSDCGGECGDDRRPFLAYIWVGKDESPDYVNCQIQIRHLTLSSLGQSVGAARFVPAKAKDNSMVGPRNPNSWLIDVGDLSPI